MDTNFRANPRPRPRANPRPRPQANPRRHPEAKARPRPQNHQRRRPGPARRWVRAGLALALAAILAGVHPLGPSTPPAAAVTFMNGWNGAFTAQQLWYQTTGFKQPRAWANAADLALGTFSDPAPMFNTDGIANGLGGSVTNMRTIGVGPVMAGINQTDPQMVAWSPTGEIVFYRSWRSGNTNRVDAVKFGDLDNATLASPAVDQAACRMADRYGGEVNPTDGTVYVLSGQGQTFDAAGTTITVPPIAIYRLGDYRDTTKTITCLAGARQLVSAGASFGEQWRAATGEGGVTTNWIISSDLAIAPNGDLYLFLENGGNRHALVRVDVPRDADGSPSAAGTWTFALVRAFTGAAASTTILGIAFNNGQLYTAAGDGQVRRWDPLTGGIARLGKASVAAVDLASVQSIPSVEGVVYDDANADGAIGPSERGAAGVTVDVWQGDQPTGSRNYTWLARTVTNANGRYYVALNSTNAEYLVRVYRPTLAPPPGSSGTERLNAFQTYASAGIQGPGVLNVVVAMCATSAGDYKSQTTSGPCPGARADGVDPAGNPTNPLSSAGGVGVASLAYIRNATRPVTMDFGVSALSSWGDAPDSYHTTNGAAGPYAAPKRGGTDYLYLGASPGTYPDGDPSPAADGHASDDGLFVAPVIPGQTNANRDWVLAQDQLLVVGQRYMFRAQAKGSAADRARIKAWITSISGGATAAATFDQPLLGGSCSDTPDASGYVYCEYQPGALTSAIVPVYARVRASDDPGVSATSRGPVDPASAPWAPGGEVEDYRLGVAKGAIRLSAATLGGVATGVKLALTNVSDVAPSRNTAEITTDAAASARPATSAHAIEDPTKAITVKTTGIGGAAALGMGGWALSDQGGAHPETFCTDRISGAALATKIAPATGELTIEAPPAGAAAHRDISCQLTYRPVVSVTASDIAVNPSGNAALADQLEILAGTANVSVTLVGAVRNASGALVNVPMPGESVELTLTADPASGALADGARFQTGQGGQWQDRGQTLTCVIATGGGCSEPIRIWGSEPGAYQVAASWAGQFLPDKASGKPTGTDPAVVYFKSGPAASGVIDLANSGDQAANWGAVPAGSADSYTLSIWVRDSAGHGVKGLADSAFTKTCAVGAAPGTDCPPASGVVFGPVVEDPGTGSNAAGHYTVAVYSSKSGPKNIGIAVAGVAGALTQLGDPAQAYVTATFQAIAAADPGQSSFTVSPAGAKTVSASDPGGANPPGAEYYHEGQVVLADANGNGITGALATGALVWADADPPASRVEITETGTDGVYQVRIWSAVAREYSGKSVKFTGAGGAALTLTESERFAFEAAEPSRASAAMTITRTADQAANHDAPGVTAANWGKQTISVTLKDALGNPYQTGVGALTASPGPGTPGLYFADPSGTGAGKFGCAAALTAARCSAGIYTLDVYSSKAGSRPVQVTFTPGQTTPPTAPFNVLEQGSGADHVDAVFTVPPPDPQAAVFVLGDPVNYPGESVIQDNWDDPSAPPDGGDSARFEVTEAFHPGVRVWDAGRHNPVQGASVTFTLTSAAPGGQCPARFEGFGGATITLLTSEAGKVSAAVTSASATQCIITATLATPAGPVPVPGSPKRLTWVNAPLDDAATSFTLSPAPVVADGVAHGTIEAVLTAPGGAPVSSAAASLAAFGPAGAGLVFSAFTHTGAGHYEATFAGTVAGSFPVEVTAGGKALQVLTPGGNGSANLIAGPPVAGSSELVGPAAGAKADGRELQIITAAVADAHANPAPGVTVIFAIPAGVTSVDAAGTRPRQAGPALVPVPTDAAGKAQLSLVSTRKGRYDVTATVGGVDITKGSPAAAVFTNADVAPARSTFEIPDAATAQPVITGFHTPKVTVFDASGNLYTDNPVQVSFRWRLAGTPAWSGPHSVTTQDGVALWSDWSVKQAGVWEVEASIPQGVIGQVLTARFKAGPAVPAASEFTSSAGTRVLNNGTDSHFASVLVRDAPGGNPVPDQAVTFTVTDGARIVGAPGTGKTSTVKTGTDGTARIAVVDSATGGESVDVSADLGAVQVGSARLEFGPDAPAAAQSTWVAEPTLPIGPGHSGVLANGQDSWTARITVDDANGLAASGATVALTHPPELTPSAPAPYITDANGQVSVQFTAKRAGAYAVRALLGTSAISPDPATVTFVAGPLDTARSYLEPPPASALADGTEQLTVRAFPLDAFGNPITAAQVRFELPAGLDVAGGSAGPTSVVVPVDALGVAALQVTSRRAGTHDVTAEVQSAPGGAWTALTNGSPAHTIFEAGPVDAGQSLIARTPQSPLPAGGTYQVTVQLMDRYKNPVRQAGVNIDFVFHRAGNPSGNREVYCRQTTDPNEVAASALTNGDGQAQVSFKQTLAGLWHSCGFYPGQMIVGGSPVDVSFTPAAASAARSRLEVSANVVEADLKATHLARAMVVDSYGNPIGGAEVQFGIDPGAAGAPGPYVAGTTQTKVTVATCDPAHALTAPAYCRQGGQFLTGLAQAEFVSGEQGSFPVTATLAGSSTALDGSPQPVEFIASPGDPARSSWSIRPDTAAPGSGGDVSLPATGERADSYALTVSVASAEQLKVPDARVRLVGLPTNVTALGGLAGQTAPPGAPNFGTFTWQLASTSAGQFSGRVQVETASGWVDVNGPFTVRFRAGPAAGSGSWLVQPGVARADGKSPSAVVARLADAHGNPATSGSVTFHIPPGVSYLGSSGTTAGPADVVRPVSAGTARIQLVAAQPGVYEVTAAVEPVGGAPAEPIKAIKDPDEDHVVASDGKLHVEFAAGPPSGPASTLTLPTAGQAVAVGPTGRHRAVVRVVDSSGHPLAGVGVVFQWTRGTAAGPGGGPWTPVTGAVSGPDGVAERWFSAPGNQAGWIWVRAFTEAGGKIQPVGGGAGGQTTLGAEFTAGPVSASGSKGSFATDGGTVLNDLAARSWARVVVKDAYGNGVGGQNVEFSLPTSAPPALGTPVFAANGDKSVTVVTCGAEPPARPDPDCEIGGVYTPGLAYAPIVSNYEGTFPVSAELETVSLGQGPVKFGPGAASPEASFFTLTPTDPAAGHVTAGSGSGGGSASGDSYTLRVTAMNGLSGGSARPVSGVCVALVLPAGMSVAPPLAPSGPCPAGEFVTDAQGTVTAQLVSTRAGRLPVGVMLGGTRVPTEPHGSATAREALFVGGPPAGSASELTSPPGPARVDDPAGLTVSVTPRDADGNLATCWAGVRQVPCEVRFEVPAGTRAGSVSGPGSVLAAGSVVSYPAAGPPSASPARVTYRGVAGRYEVTAQVGGSAVMVADSVPSTSGPAAARLEFTAVAGPRAPMVVPSDGRSVAGWVADADLASAALGGLSVAVADGAGHSLALCAVEEDGSFDCPLIPPQEPGSVLRVTIHDQQGQASPPVEVVVVGGRPPTPSPTKPPSPTGSSTAPPAGDSALAFTGADLTWALVALMAILLPLGAATARRRPRR